MDTLGGICDALNFGYLVLRLASLTCDLDSYSQTAFEEATNFECPYITFAE